MPRVLDLTEVKVLAVTPVATIDDKSIVLMASLATHGAERLHTANAHMRMPVGMQIFLYHITQKLANHASYHKIVLDSNAT